MSYYLPYVSVELKYLDTCIVNASMDASIVSIFYTYTFAIKY